MLVKYVTWQVWMPDTFFRNEKDAKFHDIIQPNLYVRVFPNGDVLYSIRVSKYINIFTTIPTTNNIIIYKGFSHTGVSNEFEIISFGYSDLPPYHSKLWLDCK